ncbi:MAG: hypothetical protein AAGG55_11425 [Pseudomonadota bacterium]
MDLTDRQIIKIAAAVSLGNSAEESWDLLSQTGVPREISLDREAFVQSGGVAEHVRAIHNHGGHPDLAMRGKLGREITKVMQQGPSDCAPAPVVASELAEMDNAEQFPWLTVMMGVLLLVAVAVL